MEPDLEEIVLEVLCDLLYVEGVVEEKREGVKEAVVAYYQDERCTYAAVPLSGIGAAIYYDL